MTDIAPVSGDAPAVVDAPAAVAPAVDTGTAPETDVFDNAEVQQFDRAYVTKLREEAARHRTEAKAAKDIFAGYSDEETAVWQELAQGLLNDPTGTAARLREIADRAAGVGAAEPAAVEPSADDDRPMTKKEMTEFIASREREADLDRRTKAIVSEAEGLGYKKDSVAWRTLMLTAQEKGTTVAEAHAAIEAERVADRQAAIDAYLKGKAGDAENTPTTGAGGAPADQTTKVTTWEGARLAAKAMRAAKQTV